MNSEHLQFLSNVCTIASFCVATIVALHLGRRIAAIVVLVTLAGITVALAPAGTLITSLQLRSVGPWPHISFVVAITAVLCGLWAYEISRLVFVLTGLACAMALIYLFAISVAHGAMEFGHAFKDAQMGYLDVLHPWVTRAMAARMEFAITLSALAAGVCLDHIILQLDHRPTHVQL